MKLERLTLFSSKNDVLFFIVFVLLIFAYSLTIEYNNYKIFTRFNSSVVDATVLKHYNKSIITKNHQRRVYQILKLKSDRGFVFYANISTSIKVQTAQKIKMVIYGGKVSFYQYLSSFYTYNKILYIYKALPLKMQLNQYIDTQHKDKNASSIYKALFSATPMPYDIQQKLSILGVSHLLAISGFHLGLLSFILYFFFSSIYGFYHKKFLPYRSLKNDIFIMVALVLFSYLYFLDFPASLVRAYGMFLMGFFLYDRGYKIVSMQTLVVSVVLLGAISPRLLLSLGFWLSSVGVFYIFLFLIHFENLSKVKQFIYIPIWTYIVMLPYSIVIFGNFSIFHPLSILATSLFSLFYPLSILLHLFGFGDYFDNALEWYLALSTNFKTIHIELYWLVLDIFISLMSVYKKLFVYILLGSNLFFLIYLIYQVA